MAQKFRPDTTATNPLIGGGLILNKGDLPGPNGEFNEHRFAVINFGMSADVNPLLYSIFFRKIKLIKRHGMPKVLNLWKLHFLSHNKHSLPRLEVSGHAALIPISSREWWKKLAKQYGLKGDALDANGDYAV
ncbi:hypothetical protein XA68_11365 [Ophiocordyceps unilateralis]|uniref:Uncharacterized protein n=1 Tax=Ophiocordyceps unilateralis TaxID=268505 RepID=A0A2A9NXZ7_OPHUN|nr:hypothetical protein XA68_11365 [Ophiocordyceps unilateralis]